MQNLHYVPMGYQQISAATLAAATALTVPAGANVALIKSDTANVRWTDDGVTAPTAAIGMLMLSTDQAYEYWGTLGQLKFILAGGSPVLNISYYKVVGG